MVTEEGNKPFPLQTISPRPFPDASVSITNGCEKSSMANTGAVIKACFRAWNAIVAS